MTENALSGQEVEWLIAAGLTAYPDAMATMQDRKSVV